MPLAPPRPRAAALAATLAAATVAACASDADICDQAREVAASCNGALPPAPAEGCVGSYAEAAEQVVARGCEAVGDGKYDEDSWYCQPTYLWLGLCAPEPLAEAAAVPSIEEICAGRADPLCQALTEGRHADARDEVRAGADASDPAVRAYVRERITAILAWRLADAAGPDPADTDAYADAADARLGEHFPAYPPGTFAMARVPLPPRPARCDGGAREALLIFPGVVRLVGRDEFAAFMTAARRELPCLETVRIETGSFVAPEVNAARAAAQVAALDQRLGRRVPLHLLGYSQGASNALRTLTDHPDLAARTRTVVTMNAAAHGSEVADLLARLLGQLGRDACASWPVLFRPTCEWAAGQGVTPGDGLLRVLAAAMGVPVDDLQAFIAAEDEVAPAPNLRAFLVGHRPGVDSLTTAAAAEFWRTRARALPTTALYVSFRSVISDRAANLPPSNALFAALLDRASGYRPWNDMQVRLVNQHLGGPVAGVEVVGPVAEGNHWQWQLAPGAVPPAIMDPAMVERTPDVDLLLAHYQALHDAGFVLAD